jgi:probable HAF family extracellular repeat protein
MKSSAWTYITAMAIFTVLATPIRTAAQEREGNTRYQVIRLGDLPGGTTAYGATVNNRGWVMGEAGVDPGSWPVLTHATLWRNGVTIDLGTLGGPGSGIDWVQKNEMGRIVILSQTANVDPNNEDFCNFPFNTELTCLGAVWQNGVLTALPTLGGYNAYPGGLNNWGQIVGAAETSTQDPTCASPQVLDFEAVVWGPKPGQIQALPPFPGDSVGAALGINDWGQVVGASGACAPYSQSVAHALLWHDGRPLDLGSLGGQNGTVPFVINNLGEIVGYSDLADNATTHAFLWTKRNHMQDLGTLPGDVFSSASGINNKGQVVGGSCDASGNCRDFLWDHGVMTDLNTLVCPGTSLYLTGNGIAGPDINDRGEITGEAYDPNTGDTPAFLAVPTDHCEVGASASSAGQKVILPESVREQLRQRKGFGRFGAGMITAH